MLYQIVLVDDEEWILSGLQNAIEWERIGFCVSGTYTNGKDALEAIEKEPPDALLSDIKMPILDGISLVKALRERALARIEVVFLSGYDDFELAQSSLRLGAVDYVLKPCTPEEIEDVFGRIKARLDERQRLEQEMYATKEILGAGVKIFKNTVYNAVMYSNGQLYKRLISQYSEFVDQEKDKTLVVISTALHGTIEGILPDREELEAINLLKQTGDLLREYEGRVDLLSNIFIFSFVFLDVADEDAEYLIGRLRRKIRKATGKYLVSGKSRRYQGFQMLEAAYGDSLDRLYQLDMLPEPRGLATKIENDTILKAAIEDKDQQIVLWSLKNWIQKIDETETEYQWKLMKHLLYVCSIFLLQSGVSVLIIENLYSCLEKHDYNTAKEKLISFVKSELLVNQQEGDKNANLCREVAKYISKNYTEEITLNNLSEIFYISPNYLGTLFKKNIGMGIKEYQATIRLEQAEALIVSGRFRLYQVAEMVGYPNYEYFRKVYCRYKGRNPSE